MKVLYYIPTIAICLCLLTHVSAQEAASETGVEQVLKQSAYDRIAPAVVKIVSDAGRDIGTGILIGVHQDRVGFILTSYSVVAGRDKVAVILRDHPDALLGRVVDKWIDFELDIAIVGVKAFPEEQEMAIIGDATNVAVGDVHSVIAHQEDRDWVPLPVELTGVEDIHINFNGTQPRGIEGAPLLNENGHMVGLVVMDPDQDVMVQTSTTALKSTIFKPILKEWFKPIPLKQKWQEKGAGFSGWVWAVGGGVLGGTIATLIALQGGSTASTPGSLPRPPNPPGQ